MSGPKEVGREEQAYPRRMREELQEGLVMIGYPQELVGEWTDGVASFFEKKPFLVIKERHECRLELILREGVSPSEDGKLKEEVVYTRSLHFVFKPDRRLEISGMIYGRGGNFYWEFETPVESFEREQDPPDHEILAIRSEGGSELMFVRNLKTETINFQSTLI